MFAVVPKPGNLPVRVTALPPVVLPEDGPIPRDDHRQGHRDGLRRCRAAQQSVVDRERHRPVRRARRRRRVRVGDRSQAPTATAPPSPLPPRSCSVSTPVPALYDPAMFAHGGRGLLVNVERVLATAEVGGDVSRCRSRASCCPRRSPLTPRPRLTVSATRWPWWHRCVVVTIGATSVTVSVKVCVGAPLADATTVKPPGVLPAVRVRARRCNRR